MTTHVFTPKVTTPCPLGTRQLEAIRWLAEGKSVAEIAIIMGQPIWTLDSYVKTAKSTAGVYKVTALVATAIRNGWIK